MTWKLDRKTIRHRRRELNRKNFPSETWFEKMLKKAGLGGYMRNLCLESRYFGDFVWINQRIVVEIDGKIHLKKKEYDKKRDDFLRSMGWDVRRIWYKADHAAADLIKELSLKVPKLDPSKVKKHKRKISKKREFKKIIAEISAEHNQRLVESLKQRQEQFRIEMQMRRWRNGR